MGGNGVRPHTDRLERDLAVLVVVDFQEKMLAAVGTAPSHEFSRNVVRLIEVARILDVPVLYTEQSPPGLGSTVEAVRTGLGTGVEPIIKTTCSCWRDAAFRQALEASKREHVVLAGLETHICIQQTVLDLIRGDYVPFVAADATGSRRAEDMTQALARMRQAGAAVATTEARILEWFERWARPRLPGVLSGGREEPWRGWRAPASVLGGGATAGLWATSPQRRGCLFGRPSAPLRRRSSRSHSLARSGATACSSSACGPENGCSSATPTRWRVSPPGSTRPAS